ncbi:MAG TPA: MBL fold metallo-hydrolase, partial [Acidimicrobiia bacterium]|nr:MBL fold metallo-hydrolase [Acidimicrobiia bacterium]
MIFRQFVDDDLGCASYLVGDETTQEAIIVDPSYAIEPYLAAAAQEHVRIVRTLETHTHADHVSGHGRLAFEHGIPVAIHRAAEVEYEHDPLEDGQEIVLGDVVLRVIHTPGHRPEHCCFTVIDRTRADEPWLLLTGDSLFVGDAARPDLAVEAVDGARELYASLRRLLELPDGVEVYPGHVAGSLCGASMSSKASTTIGFERRFNPMLGAADVEEFVSASALTRAPRPPNLDRIVELNRGSFVGAAEPLVERDGLEPP